MLIDPCISWTRRAGDNFELVLDEPCVDLEGRADGDDALDLGADLMDESEVALFFFIGSEVIEEAESFEEEAKEVSDGAGALDHLQDAPWREGGKAPELPGLPPRAKSWKRSS